MLDQLRISDFEPRLGQRFALRVQPDEAATIDLVLAQASALAHGEQRRRAPFSLVFRGPLRPVLPQRIYRLEHDELGALEIFLVPVGPDTEGMRYEAIFT